MAIKDQCRGCRHFTGEYNVCPELNSVPDYNSHSCDVYTKKTSSINLSKPGEVSSGGTSSSSQQNSQTPSTGQQSPLPAPSPSPSGPTSTRQGMFSRAFSFSGRIRRTEYCLTVLLYYVYYFVYSAVIEATESTGVIIFMMLTLIPMLWLFWAQGAKRCHDRDNSGFYMLIPFYMFVMMFGKGDTGTNSYGDDPKA